MPTIGVLFGIGAASPSEIWNSLPEGYAVQWMVGRDDTQAARLRQQLELYGPVTFVEDALNDEQSDMQGVAGIATFCDRLVLPAAVLSERLGLPGNTVETANLLSNKYLQRERLLARGVQRLNHLVSHSVAELEEDIRQLKLPAVIKPVKSEGSRFTFRIRTVRDLSWVGPLIDAKVWISGMIAEEEIRGRGPNQETGLADYVSVETISEFGKHYVAGVTARFPVAEPFRETGGAYPSDLNLVELEEVGSAAVEGLQALDVSTGVSHVEVMLTNHGPEIIEINGRLGGNVNHLIGRTGGPNLIGRELAIASSTKWSWPRWSPVGIAFLYQMPAPMILGVVESAEGVDLMRAIPHVERLMFHARRGTNLDWRNGTSSCLLEIHGFASNYMEMNDCINAVDETIVITESTAQDRWTKRGGSWTRI